MFFLLSDLGLTTGLLAPSVVSSALDIRSINVPFSPTPGTFVRRNACFLEWWLRPGRVSFKEPNSKLRSIGIHKNYG